MKQTLTVITRNIPFFIIAYFWCIIEPSETYTWYYGLWHGSYTIPNWIISFFQDDRLVKAVEYSTSYNICWWAFTILTAIYFFFVAMAIILIIFGKKAVKAEK